MKQAAITDKPLVTDILSQSFADNKSVNRTIGKKGNKQHKINGLIRYCFYKSRANNGAWLADNGKGAALFTLPHEKAKINIKEELKLALRVIGLHRIPGVLKRESYIKKHHPKSPFLYLWFIGVLPEYQRSGTGSQLLKDIHAHADKMHLPVCLETSTIENLPFYKSHGYSIYHEWYNKASGFTLYFLKREPIS